MMFRGWVPKSQAQAERCVADLVLGKYILG